MEIISKVFWWIASIYIVGYALFCIVVTFGFLSEVGLEVPIVFISFLILYSLAAGVIISPPVVAKIEKFYSLKFSLLIRVLILITAVITTVILS